MPQDATSPSWTISTGLDLRMKAAWRIHGAPLSLYFALKRHPLVGTLALEPRQRKVTRHQVAPSLTAASLPTRPGLHQGQIVSMHMGVLIDILAKLAVPAQLRL